MTKYTSAVLALGLLMSATGFARGKKKPTLPPYILNARTVAVIIDPDAGISVDKPRANEVAQKDVENALMKWGRFDPVIGTEAADLIIVVRRGNGRLVNATIRDPWQNNRDASVNHTDNGVSIGAQHGRQPDLSDPRGNNSSPHPQTEIGQTEDSFIVYQGKVSKPLDSVPGWRYVAKDALHSHDVPAVAEFQKALDAAVKAAASKGP